MLYCHAGCCTKGILTEIGLVYSDIDTNITPEDVRPKWQTYIEKIMPGYAVTARYDYKDEQGKYLYSNIRLANNEGKKTFRQGIIRLLHEVSTLSSRCNLVLDFLYSYIWGR